MSERDANEEAAIEKIAGRMLEGQIHDWQRDRYLESIGQGFDYWEIQWERSLEHGVVLLEREWIKAVKIKAYNQVIDGVVKMMKSIAASAVTVPKQDGEQVASDEDAYETPDCTCDICL